MPTWELPAEEALGNLAGRSHARWFRAGIDVMDDAGEYAVQRINSGLFTPGITPDGLRIGPDDGLFAIGSCFARGIEQLMQNRGFDVPSYASEFDDFELATPTVTGRGFTNKYNSFAIRNEIRWALDPSWEFAEESIVDIGNGVCADPHTNPTLKWVNRESTMRRREVIRSVYARLATTRVVVVTLGLVEVWFDLKAGCHLNMTPIPPMAAGWPDRYEFRVTSYLENREAVEEISDMLDAYGHPDVAVVVTVSPVPLNATFSDRDVVIANAYSKAVLRAVADDWAASHDNVHYFPSYEIVTNSGRGLAWEMDGRHVRPELVKHIMAVFERSFIDVPN